VAKMPSERIRLVAENVEESDRTSVSVVIVAVAVAVDDDDDDDDDDVDISGATRLVLVTYLPFSDSTAQIHFLQPLKHFRLYSRILTDAYTQFSPSILTIFVEKLQIFSSQTT